MYNQNKNLSNRRPPIDIGISIYQAFRSIEQDSMMETTFRHILAETIAAQADSYTVVLRLWEEHGYIKVLRQPGQPRAIEIGTAYERDYPCLM